MISIVIPVLNEAANMVALLTPMQPLRRRGYEIVVVDGGSGDETVRLARPLSDKLVVSARGRSRQMNVGAAHARGDVLWFVHADSRLNPQLPAQLEAALNAGHCWGRFNVRLSGRGMALRLIAWSMNQRSCLSGIATGDQGIFVERRAFQAIGGFPDIPLMEDIVLSRRLKRLARPACLPGPLIASSRRWERHGVWRTVLLMWRLRLAFFLGADPHRLHARYYRGGG